MILVMCDENSLPLCYRILGTLINKPLTKTNFRVYLQCWLEPLIVSTIFPVDTMSTHERNRRLNDVHCRTSSRPTYQLLILINNVFIDK